jgi:hypothetical protein
MEMKEQGDPNYGAPKVTDKRAQARTAAEQEFQAAQEMSTEEKLALLQAQAAADDSTPVVPNYTAVLTAFIVVLDHEGNVQASSELGVLENLSLARPATFSDMFSAAAHIQKDIAGQETTHRVMTGLAQQAAAAQQAAMAQKIQGQMGLVPRR